MTHNPYKYHNKASLVKLHLKYKQFQKKLEEKLETLLGEEYILQLGYNAHFNNEFVLPVKQMLDKTKRNWNMKFVK